MPPHPTILHSSDACFVLALLSPIASTKQSPALSLSLLDGLRITRGSFLPGADPRPMPSRTWSAVSASAWFLIPEGRTTAWVSHLLNKPSWCLSVSCLKGRPFDIVSWTDGRI